MILCFPANGHIIPRQSRLYHNRTPNTAVRAQRSRWSSSCGVSTTPHPVSFLRIRPPSLTMVPTGRLFRGVNRVEAVEELLEAPSGNAAVGDEVRKAHPVNLRCTRAHKVGAGGVGGRWECGSHPSRDTEGLTNQSSGMHSRSTIATVCNTRRQACVLVLMTCTYQLLFSLLNATLVCHSQHRYAPAGMVLCIPPLLPSPPALSFACLSDRDRRHC